MKILTYRSRKKVLKLLFLTFIFGYTVNFFTRKLDAVKEQENLQDPLQPKNEIEKNDLLNIPEATMKIMEENHEDTDVEEKPLAHLVKEDKKQADPQGADGDGQMAPLQPPKLNDGPGEMGKPVIVDVNKLSPEEQQKYKNLTLKYGFHAYVSDMISERRSLPDFRDEKCKELRRYPVDLPKSSVILCFHNEAWSVLLRSVHSILERTPDHLLEEVILVDDFSEFENLKAPLDKYMKQYPKVKLIRTSKREGLVRARIIGAKAAIGPVLIFLDSHIECTEGWLEPLVAMIDENPKTAVAPRIDVIDQETFELKGMKCEENGIGGFNWGLSFDWISIPNRIKKALSHPCDPTPSPTMAGGLFGIGKEFFKHLGYYDEQMDVWGAENLELSFKLWMCGGKLFQIPCSHVGHIYRRINPYGAKSAAQFGNFVRKNTLRLAETWLDEYKEIYYKRTPRDLSQMGDITEVLAKRKELGCQSFNWYIKNVYPEVFIPGKGPAFGEVRAVADLGSPKCLDGLTETLRQPVGVYSCHGKGLKQLWSLTELGELRNDIGCVDYNNNKLMLFGCHGSGGNQLWIYRLKTKQLYHKASQTCLGIIRSDDNQLTLSAVNCEPINGLNQWTFTNSNETALGLIEKEFS